MVAVSGTGADLATDAAVTDTGAVDMAMDAVAMPTADGRATADAPDTAARDLDLAAGGLADSPAVMLVDSVVVMPAALVAADIWAVAADTAAADTGNP
jgi:hypothetical protein